MSSLPRDLYATLSSMIAFSRVTKRYGSIVALSDVTFTVAPQECVCITGPESAGKSTLLRMLLRAEAPNTGSISIDNVDLQLLPPAILRLYRQRIGLKLATGNLFLRKTIEENLTFPLALRAVPERERERVARNMLERLGLLDSREQCPPDLTAEGRTLLGLGRALVADPMILLLSEPFADLSLDAFTLATTLLTEAHRRGKTVLCFSRDESIASALSARHIRLAAGKIVGDSPATSGDAIPLSSTIHHILARALFRHRSTSLPSAKEAQKVAVSIL